VLVLLPFAVVVGAVTRFPVWVLCLVDGPFAFLAPVQARRLDLLEIAMRIAFDMFLAGGVSAGSALQTFVLTDLSIMLSWALFDAMIAITPKCRNEACSIKRQDIVDVEELLPATYMYVRSEENYGNKSHLALVTSSVRHHEQT